MAFGRHRDVVGELELLVDEYPFREQFYGQLMLALYRSDRQAEALDVYRRARRRLVDELGLEPGRTLVELEAAILRHDPAPLPEHQSTPATPLDIVRRQPMVGRADELAQLRTLWSATFDGPGRVAFLTGEAGVGKTRLAAEVAAEAASQGAIVLLGHCDQAAPIPYAPLTDALQASAEVADAFTQAPLTHQHLLTGLVQPPLESHEGTRKPRPTCRTDKARSSPPRPIC